jgi:hypothetical protein
MVKWVPLFSVLVISVPQTWAADYEFEIVNSSNQIIDHLQFAPTATSNWGGDQLGEDEEDALEPGAWIKVRDLQPGTYDIRIVHADETSCVIRHVVLEPDKTVTITDHLLESCRQ